MKAKIKKLRKVIGWTQERLGKELGVKRRTVHTWESKKNNRNPNPSAMKRLGELFKKYSIG